MLINITVEKKRAAVIGTPIIICGNSDYTIEFAFDEEWAELETKTARFVYVQNGAVKHEDQIFTGNTVAVPILINTRLVRIGVFAGNLRTTTPAMVPCVGSILCNGGPVADPLPDQYNQIMELLNKLDTGGGADEDVEQLLDPQIIDNAYLEWYSSSDHAAGVYVQTYSNAKFKLHRYAVTAGTKYRLQGAAVRLFGNYPLAAFSSADTPTKTQPGALILEATAAEQDFDTTYIPDQDGYVIVAVHTDYGVLSVSQMGGVVKTPLKIQVFGDSLTENGGAAVWPELLAEALPEYALTVINSGKGGNTLTEYTVLSPYEWPAGNAVTDAAGVVKGVAYQIVNRAADEAVLDALEATADLYIIAAGGNDYASGVDLGGFRDGNLSTVYGAVQRIIEQIHSNTAGRILFVTPLQRYSATDAEREASGWLDERGNILNAADGYAQEQLAEVIRDTCGFYGVPVVDFYREAGISRYNIGRFAADGLHVNAQAAKRLAVMVAGKIRQLF